MTGVTALGPWPGTGVLASQTAVVGLLGDVPDGVTGIPPLLQLPARGPSSQSVARTAGLLTEMPVDLGPHGWRLADRPGRDQERIAAAWREDVDALAVAAHGWTGPVLLSLRGPWSVAAELWLARGDRVLSDPGAVRDLVDSQADGLATAVASLRSAVPGAEPVLVLREPALPDVLGGTVPTFSGHGRLRAPEAQVATQALRTVVEGARAAGVRDVVVHVGSRFASRSWDVAAGCGADAVGVALAGVRGPQQWERIAAAVESGLRTWWGLPRDRAGKRAPAADTAGQLVRPWRSVGLPADALADVVVHTESSGGLGGDLVVTRERDARTALSEAVLVARALADRAAGA